VYIVFWLANSYEKVLETAGGAFPIQAHMIIVYPTPVNTFTSSSYKLDFFEKVLISIKVRICHLKILMFRYLYIFGTVEKPIVISEHP